MEMFHRFLYVYQRVLTTKNGDLPTKNDQYPSTNYSHVVNTNDICRFCKYVGAPQTWTKSMCIDIPCI